MKGSRIRILSTSNKKSKRIKYFYVSACGQGNCKECREDGFCLSCTAGWGLKNGNCEKVALPELIDPELPSKSCNIFLFDTKIIFNFQ